MVNTNTFTKNNKFLRQSMNIIQSKNHEIRTYEINTISLIKYMLNNEYYGLALVYQSLS